MWCNVSNAGSIKDYEKGGMKLGKSLLELMTYDEIVEELRPISHGDDFISTLYIPNPFTYPEEIGLYLVIFKSDDEKFIIQGFSLFEQLLEKLKNDLILILINLTIVQENKISEQQNLNKNKIDPKFIGKKIGRNEPCFCGSNKKYKHCCGSI